MYHSKIKALIRNRGGDNDDLCGTQAEDQFLTIVCPKILSSTFGRFLININIHVKEKMIEIDKRGNFPVIFIDTVSFFTRKKFTRTKTDL